MAPLPFSLRRRRRRLLAASSFLAVTLVAATAFGAKTPSRSAVQAKANSGAADCVSVAGHRVCRRLGRVRRAGGADTTSRADHVYTRVVSALAGHRTRVYCWSRGDWRARAAERVARSPGAERLGPWRAFTRMSRRSVHLSPEICTELARLAREPDPLWRGGSVDGLAWAVETLAHEAVHARGIADEAKAECYGMQAIPQVAAQLGRTPLEGRYLAAVYWKHWYAWLQTPFRSPECRNGGRLDLHARNRWP
jgi:hypothetical protein